MIFSRTCEYAIRTLLYVATPQAEGPIPIREIAQVLAVPTTTLAKVIHSLTRHGLLVSHKGPGGGVTLGRSADSLTLLDVVERIDGSALKTECVLGVPGCCEPTTHCPLHDQWRKVREEILEVLGSRTLAQLSEDLVGRDYSLAGFGGGAAARVKAQRRD